MAINPSVKSLIDHCQRRVFLCHQVPLTILRFLRSGKKQIQGLMPSAGFAQLLQQKRDAARLYDVKEAIPPNLYEVFGYFKYGELGHSSIVVDTSPEVILAECDTPRNIVNLNPLKRSLTSEFAQTVYLYPAQVLDEVLLALPRYLQQTGDLFSLL